MWQAGEELTVSYVDLFEGFDSRQQAIQEKRFFTCACARCEAFRAASACVLAGTPLPAESGAGAGAGAGAAVMDEAAIVAQLLAEEEAEEARRAKGKGKKPAVNGAAASAAAAAAAGGAGTPKAAAKKSGGGSGKGGEGDASAVPRAQVGAEPFRSSLCRALSEPSLVLRGRPPLITPLPAPTTTPAPYSPR